MNYKIRVKNLTKSFKDVVALNKVNLSFEEGKIYGIMGRNGSGKTVLMKCITGLMNPSSGQIYIDGHKLCQEDFQKMGIIIETPGFVENQNAYNNLKYLAKINNKIGKEEIINTIEFVGLDPFNKKHVKKYSLGMRQRLGIAQAIMEDPEILILDEPMNGLDNQGVQDMRELFLKLKEKGKTIILASHNKTDIEVLCDTVIEMDHGQILESTKIDWKLVELW